MENFKDDIVLGHMLDLLEIVRIGMSSEPEENHDFALDLWESGVASKYNLGTLNLNIPDDTYTVKVVELALETAQERYLGLLSNINVSHGLLLKFLLQDLSDATGEPHEEILQRLEKGVVETFDNRGEKNE